MGGRPERHLKLSNEPLSEKQIKAETHVLPPPVFQAIKPWGDLKMFNPFGKNTDLQEFDFFCVTNLRSVDNKE